MQVIAHLIQVHRKSNELEHDLNTIQFNTKVLTKFLH